MRLSKPERIKAKKTSVLLWSSVVEEWWFEARVGLCIVPLTRNVTRYCPSVHHRNLTKRQGTGVGGEVYATETGFSV